MPSRPDEERIYGGVTDFALLIGLAAFAIVIVCAFSGAMNISQWLLEATFPDPPHDDRDCQEDARSHPEIGEWCENRNMTICCCYTWLECRNAYQNARYESAYNDTIKRVA